LSSFAISHARSASRTGSTAPRQPRTDSDRWKIANILNLSSRTESAGDMAGFASCSIYLS
jgi:hypothetical protein